MSISKGHFIVFEGIDGSGKTTQINLLKKHIEANNFICHETKEPTDGAVGSLLRQCLAGKVQMDETTLAALFAADRLDHILNDKDGLIKKLEKPVFILGVGIVLYVITARFLPYKPNLFPLLPYNADCALYYMIYYCTGYCVFPKLQDFLQCGQEKKRKRNIVLAVAGIAGGSYAVCLFFGKDMLAPVLKLPVLRIFHPYLSAMILICVSAVLAFCLQKSRMLQCLGRESLYLCGNEFIIKTIVTIAASFLGVSVPSANPFSGVLYVVILLLLTHFVLIPLEKPVIDKIFS